MSDYDEIAERFARETADHEMAVVHDAGMYRHLRFANPQSSLYWYEISTTPGQLTFSGDGESFTFRVATDMFEMVRRSTESGDINATYWAEKCKTSNARSYQRERFEEYVEKQVAEAEQYYPGLREDVEREIGDSLVWDLDSERDVLLVATQYTFYPELAPGALTVRGSFSFRSVFDWQLRDFNWWFLFACHAISDAVAKYDATICGSRCPEHADHYCRRSPGHQPGICRDVKQKGWESCTWDPAAKAVLR
ncbi:hypothetical protein [Streptomyces sp. NPDC086182]|uniref:hypothetical protein n=1 Tax=Streptomyces sp. NPDC086182 TaxID=3155058 RepID=UPI00342130BA